ncbi:MAG: glucose-6-phosphate dehydrogenase, partial [Thermoplasmata archaeon]
MVGATGDLVERKLLPALWRLLPAVGCEMDNSQVLGVARRSMGEGEYRAWAVRALRTEIPDPPAEIKSWVEARMGYQSTGAGGPEDFQRLARRIEAVEAEHQLPGNRIFYLAVPAPAFAPFLEGLAGAGLVAGPGWTRLVLEKPFGRDLASARKLNACIHRHFQEPQVFRIDHYLGKESVQNLLVFRFANMLFE